MKKTLVIVYGFLFAIVSFGFVTAGSNSIAIPSATTIADTIIVPFVPVDPVISTKPVVSPNPVTPTTPIIPSMSLIVVWNDYDLIAKKIFNKFLVKYPYLTQQVSCENVDNYVDKIIKKTKIKFRTPDINKENIVKNKFGNLLRDYLNNALECDDFIDVDRDDNTIGTEEYVTCLFDNGWNQELQSCYSSDEKWSCKWIGSCSIKVSWYVGENISWKSSCGGYASTLVDGENEYAKFYCPKPIILEKVDIIKWKIDNIKNINQNKK